MDEYFVILGFLIILIIHLWYNKFTIWLKEKTVDNVQDYDQDKMLNEDLEKKLIEKEKGLIIINVFIE